MNRREFLASLAAAGTAPHAVPGIAAEIALTRDSDDLLAAFTIVISLRNATRTIVGLDFPTADLFRIDLRSEDGTVQWSSASGHKPLPIARRVDVPPGLYRLVSEIVDGTTDDRRCLAAGRYTVRVSLLGTELRSSVERPVAFAPPLSIAAALERKPGLPFTIAGMPAGDAGGPRLSDETGSIALSHPLGLHPTGSYVVRGSLEQRGEDSVQLAVERFAPAFDNLAQARPTIPTR